MYVEPTCVCETDTALGSADHTSMVYLQCVLLVCVCHRSQFKLGCLCVCTVCVCVQYRLHSAQQKAVAHCPSVNFISHGQYQIPAHSQQSAQWRQTYVHTYSHLFSSLVRIHQSTAG